MAFLDELLVVPERSIDENHRPFGLYREGKFATVRNIKTAINIFKCNGSRVSAVSDARKSYCFWYLFVLSV